MEGASHEQPRKVRDRGCRRGSGRRRGHQPDAWQRRDLWRRRCHRLPVAIADSNAIADRNAIADAGAEPTPLALFPPDGPLAAGTHTAVLEGVRVSFTIPGPGWTANYGVFIGFGANDGQPHPEDYSLALWDNAPDDVYSDPCAHTRLSPPPDHTTIGLAAAAAAIPGTDLVSGPESVEVGGRPAQHVVFTVREDLGCDPTDAYLWVYDGDRAANNWHWASALGSTHQVWTIDVDGKVIWIDSESYKGAGPEVEQAIQQVIDSITFE